MAAEVGVSTTVLKDYRDRGCPLESAAAVQAWREENLSGAKQRAASPESHGRTLLELAILREKLDKERTANQVRKGELVPIDEIERRIRRHIFNARAILGQLPQRLAKIHSEGGGRRAAGRVRAAAVRLIDAACIQLEESLAREAEETPPPAEPPSKKP